jgi:hypothetical protein
VFPPKERILRWLNGKRKIYAFLKQFCGAKQTEILANVCLYTLTAGNKSRKKTKKRGGGSRLVQHIRHRE